jgi:hypothetical protein
MEQGTGNTEEYETWDLGIKPNSEKTKGFKVDVV